MRHWIILVTFACFIMSSKNSLAERMHDLMASSDVVAIVDLESGNMVLDEQRGCTMVYGATVIKAFKGTDEAEKVSFRVEKPLLLGWTYLVFVTKQAETSRQAPPRKRANITQSEGCPVSDVKANVVTFGTDAHYPAIFELRLLPPAADSNDVGTYYAGPPSMLQLFKGDIAYRTITVNRPYLSEIEAIVDAKEVEQLISGSE